jgi:hypothetical protein
MAAAKRVARIAAIAALLAVAGLAAGFVAALVRPRPTSRYAARRASPAEQGSSAEPNPGGGW